MTISLKFNPMPIVERPKNLLHQPFATSETSTQYIFYPLGAVECNLRQGIFLICAARNESRLKEGFPIEVFHGVPQNPPSIECSGALRRAAPLRGALLRVHVLSNDLIQCANDRGRFKIFLVGSKEIGFADILTAKGG